MNRICLLLIGVFYFIMGVAQNKKPIGVNIEQIKCFIDETPSSKIQLISINVIGNKKTKDYIILREMSLKIGDSVNASYLYDELVTSHGLIYNTNLFSDVALTAILISPNTFKIEIKVLEKWYVYPIPQFELIDRNFNEWWKTYNADLDRVVYGLRFTHYNFSGRADKLNAYLLDGYSKKYLLSYSQPYSNSALTQGFSFNGHLFQNRELPIKTAYNNKVILYKSKSINKKNWGINSSFSSRNGLYKKNTYSILYEHIAIADTILSESLNPNYFNVNKSSIGFFDFGYKFEYINTNNINYPLNGKIYSLSIAKRGLSLKNNINMLSLDMRFKKFFTLRNNFYSSIHLASKLKIPFKQAYINQHAFGYGDYNLRGLDYYVIDGVVSGLAKCTFSKKVFSLKIPLPFKSKYFPFLPFSCYAKTYFDAGYVYNQAPYVNILNNKFLYTGGIGIDILSIYDLKISVEYSINQLREKGLFLDTRGFL